MDEKEALPEKPHWKRLLLDYLAGVEKYQLPNINLQADVSPIVNVGGETVKRLDGHSVAIELERISALVIAKDKARDVNRCEDTLFIGEDLAVIADGVSVTQFGRMYGRYLAYFIGAGLKMFKQHGIAVDHEVYAELATGVVAILPKFFMARDLIKHLLQLQVSPANAAARTAPGEMIGSSTLSVVIVEHDGISYLLVGDGGLAVFDREGKYKRVIYQDFNANPPQYGADAHNKAITLVPPEAFRTGKIQLQPGDRWVLFSDGLIKALDDLGVTIDCLSGELSTPGKLLPQQLLKVLSMLLKEDDITVACGVHAG